MTIRTQTFLVAGGDKLYTFNRPETGIWRITPSGDWTNAGTISYQVDIWTTNVGLRSTANWRR